MRCKYFCSLGAGIVVNTINIPRLYTQLVRDPLCVLLLEDKSQSLINVDPNHVGGLIFLL